MKTKLEFEWREGDLALKACPARLVRFSDDEENVTINFVSYYRNDDGKERSYSIGYFKYKENDGYWELILIGDRFKEVKPEESAELWKQLGLAYDILDEWVRKRGDDVY